MCAALPARVISLETDTAFVEVGETRFEVGRRFLPQALPGDWVLIHAGQIVSLVSTEEASAIRELLRDIMALDRVGEPTGGGP